MKNVLRVIFLGSACIVATQITGCSDTDRGPMEKIGREVDDAVGDATDKHKSLADKAGEKLRKLGDDIEDRG